MPDHDELPEVELPQRRGWYKIPGIQDGEYDVKERLYIFSEHKIAKVARNASVLELGCAEGLIGKWLMDARGARQLHGLDKHADYVTMARRLMRGYDAKFAVCDFDTFETWREEMPDWLNQDGYDLVLMMRVLQKLARPAWFLQAVMPLVKHLLVVQIPTRILDDPRSRNEKLDIVEVLDGFKLTREIMVGGEFTGVFRRK